MRLKKILLIKKMPRKSNTKSRSRSRKSTSVSKKAKTPKKASAQARSASFIRAVEAARSASMQRRTPSRTPSGGRSMRDFEAFVRERRATVEQLGKAQLRALENARPHQIYKAKGVSERALEAASGYIKLQR